MHYHLVKFYDGTTNIVPDEWVIDGNKCLWPKESETNVGTLAKERAMPQPNWKPYKCQILDSSSK